MTFALDPDLSLFTRLSTGRTGRRAVIVAGWSAPCLALATGVVSLHSILPANAANREVDLLAAAV